MNLTSIQPSQQQCPHLGTGPARCLAAFNGLPINGDRRRLCETEDYDLCGIFLARMLRQSRAFCYTPAVDVSSR
ncbi:hypothetical protein [Desulfuromonas sp. AOP6]|uniref:hypothetical protein n=1 Tax=Desulfuromonas sp. AOP6 TaxID=1566351 RepID=UPI00126FBF3E|nr:hypothetical protein [Desulfuromonas sp. AOP6]BCA78519.1 hypothetical protein AOP6_0306 [Desulfuromonas sp. AOP6]